jgi:hypothetical protein
VTQPADIPQISRAGSRVTSARTWARVEGGCTRTPVTPVLQIRLARDAFSPGPLAIIVSHRERTFVSSSRSARAWVRPVQLVAGALCSDASCTSPNLVARERVAVGLSAIRFSGATFHLTRIPNAQLTTEEHRGRFPRRPRLLATLSLRADGRAPVPQAARAAPLLRLEIHSQVPSHVPRLLRPPVGSRFPSRARIR